MPKFKISDETFWVIFKQCDLVCDASVGEMTALFDTDLSESLFFWYPFQKVKTEKSCWQENDHSCYDSTATGKILIFLLSSTREERNSIVRRKPILTCNNGPEKGEKNTAAER